MTAVLAMAACAQQPEPMEGAHAPQFTLKEFLAVNGVQLGASAFAAAGSWYGARRCIHENDSRFLGPDRHTPRDEFAKTAAIAGGIDIAAAVISWKLRRRHPGVAAALPLISAGAQTALGATQFSAGCF